MKRNATFVVAILAALLLYPLAWPVPVDPVAWDATEDRSLTGVLETRGELYLSSLVGRALPVLSKEEPG